MSSLEMPTSVHQIQLISMASSLVYKMIWTCFPISHLSFSSNYLACFNMSDKMVSGGGAAVAVEHGLKIILLQNGPWKWCRLEPMSWQWTESRRKIVWTWKHMLASSSGSPRRQPGPQGWKQYENKPSLEHGQQMVWETVYNSYPINKLFEQKLVHPWDCKWFGIGKSYNWENVQTVSSQTTSISSMYNNII